MFPFFGIKSCSHTQHSENKAKGKVFNFGELRSPFVALEFYQTVRSEVRKREFLSQKDFPSFVRKLVL